MRLQATWTQSHGSDDGLRAGELVRTSALCATVAWEDDGELDGDPTEIALVEGAAAHAAPVDLARRDAGCRVRFRFDPRLRLLSVVQGEDANRLRVIVKGAPEAVLNRVADSTAAAAEAAEQLARDGTRVLAVAVRELPPVAERPAGRQDAETELKLLGRVGLYDPPRSVVVAAVRRCHEAGLRVCIVTGDNGATAAVVAREVGSAHPTCTLWRSPSP